jgi:glycosyltransferase involved in cell wall biosynthesis
MKQRVLIFSTAYFPLIGGAEVALKEITDRIPDFEFHLFCARIKPGLAETERIGNVTVHRCGFGHSIDKYLLALLGPWKAFVFERAYATTPVSPSASRTPLIWSLMASYGGFASLVYTWFYPHARMLLTIQEGDPVEHYAKRAGLFGWLHRAVFKRANRVQAISRFLADWSVKMGFKGVPDIIPNGVNIEKFQAEKGSMEQRKRIRDHYGFSEQDIVLVTASRLSLKNAVDDLIRSLRELPQTYKAFIVGAGEDGEMLHALTAELGLESRVVFAGSKTHDELPAILQSADVFVRASLSEGLGNSFLEAMAAGIPIVGTEVGGIPDFLKDGETGLFCEPRNPSSLAKAVRRIQEEPGLRSRLVENGVRLVRERYDWDSIACQMKALLQTLPADPHL